jgi:hypothetical protein
MAAQTGLTKVIAVAIPIKSSVAIRFTLKTASFVATLLKPKLASVVAALRTQWNFHWRMALATEAVATTTSVKTEQLSTVSSQSHMARESPSMT